MGAELAPTGSARPRKDARAGEACASHPSSFASRGAAADGVSGAPFGFFAVGASLAGRYGHQASATKQETRQGSSTYTSSPAGSSSLRPYLKPESRLQGPASRGAGAGGAPADRLGAGADPRGISPARSFFGTRGRLPPPARHHPRRRHSERGGERRTCAEEVEPLTRPRSQPPFPAPLPPSLRWSRWRIRPPGPGSLRGHRPIPVEDGHGPHNLLPVLAKEQGRRSTLQPCHVAPDQRLEDRSQILIGQDRGARVGPPHQKRVLTKRSQLMLQELPQQPASDPRPSSPTPTLHGGPQAPPETSRQSSRGAPWARSAGGGRAQHLPRPTCT